MNLRPFRPAAALPVVLVVGLLAGTAAAFAVTERLKLELSPIYDTRLERKVFSPVCGCAKEQATVSFQLREPDRLTVAIVDGDEVVRTILDSEPAAAGGVAVSWDGRDDAGRIVPEGTYSPRVHLDEARQTIVLPNPIRVDVTPPEPPSFTVEPRTFSPDGDGRNDKVAIRYRLEERAHALVYVEGRRRIRSRSQQPEGKVDWGGRADGKALPARAYGLTMAAEDPAGNVGARSGPVTVRIRYVELARESIRAAATTRFGVIVRSDATQVSWRFAGGRGTGPPGLLVLRAPRNPGRYTLFVEANGRAARADVLVVPRER